MTFRFAFVAANTSRTRAYLNAMERSGYLPSWILYLDSNDHSQMLGQASSDLNRVVDPQWPEADFNPTEPILPWISKLNIPYSVSGTRDINSDIVISLIADSDFQVFLYSGYGGVLLRNSVLSLGKSFLHIHGGYLPEFKGSTTNYYSLLVTGLIGASSIFLTSEIDGGPIFHRENFTPPTDKREIDHFYDSAARSRVLVNTLIAFDSASDNLPSPIPSSQGNTYYIIHPVLKHLSILAASS